MQNKSERGKLETGRQPPTLKASPCSDEGDHIHSSSGREFQVEPHHSRLGESRALTCRGHLPATPAGGPLPPASFTLFLLASPDPGFVNKDHPPSSSPFPGPSCREAGAGQGRLPGARRGLTTTPCPAGAPSRRARPPGRPRICPSPAGPVLRPG